jgi:hypothetical protein
MKTRTIRVNVTEGNIKHGVRNSVSECALALALRAHGSEALVDFRHLYFSDGRGVWSADLTPVLIDFMDAFDAGDDVAPISVPVTFRGLGCIVHEEGQS